MGISARCRVRTRRSLRHTLTALFVLTLAFATVQTVLFASPARAAVGFGKSLLPVRTQ